MSRKKKRKIKYVIKGVEFKDDMVILKEYQEPTEQEKEEMRAGMAKLGNYFPEGKNK